MRLPVPWLEIARERKQKNQHNNNMNDNFFKFIGAIEATVHFISTQTTTGPELLIFPGQQPGAQTNESTPTPDGRTVKDELNALLSVKTGFLNAYAGLSHGLKGLVHPDTGAMLSHANKAKINEKWNAFFKAIDGQAKKFFDAVTALRDWAPEWSVMDASLKNLIIAFKNALKIGGGGDPPSATSWGSSSSSSMFQSSSGG